jgi:hypothetical protein
VLLNLVNPRFCIIISSPREVIPNPFCGELPFESQNKLLKFICEINQN